MTRKLSSYLTYIDRSHWGKGEWDNEPDQLWWIDDKTQLACLVRRSLMGDFCGYVGVSEAHFLHNIEPEPGLISHQWTVTAGQLGAEGTDFPDDLWWFGFRCGQALDLTPAARAQLGLCAEMAEIFEEKPPLVDKYCNIQCAAEQVNQLANRLFNIQSKLFI
jgi:hypothetical protein